MKRIEVNTNMLNNSAVDINSDIDGVLSIINRTYEGICVLDGMWEGPANEEFNRQFITDYERLKEICGELQRFSERLTEAKNKYEEAEGKVHAAVEAIIF